MANDAAALGQEIGKIFEKEILNQLRPIVESKGYSISPEKLVDGTENTYQIDAVIRNPDGQPVILIDPKYIRYKKHNRDKGSWLCTAHYNLHKSHPSVRKTIAVLAGNWSGPSKSLITSFGIEIHMLEFQRMLDVLRKYGIEFDWDEKDRETPRNSLAVFRSLNECKKQEIASELISGVIGDVRKSIIDTLDSREVKNRICKVEVVMRTMNNEFVFREFDNVRTMLENMLEFVSDVEDIDN